MSLAEELEALERELKTLYLSIAEAYKRMSKVSDEYRLNILQDTVNRHLADEKTLRAKIAAKREEIKEEWQKNLATASALPPR